MSKVLAIALTTFRESIRSKVLYSALFFALFIIAVSALFSSVSMGDKIKVIKDLSFCAISFFAAGYAIISSSYLFAKEIRQKTIFNIMSKPIHRYQFIAGKFFGLFLSSASLTALLSLVVFIYCLYLGDTAFNIFLIGFHILLQTTILSAVTIFFSTIVVTPVISGLASFGVFLAARSSQYFTYLINSEMNEFTKSFLYYAYYLIPHFNAIDIAEQGVYAASISPDVTIWSVVYTVSYCAAAIFLACFFFSRSEIAVSQ